MLLAATTPLVAAQSAPMIETDGFAHLATALGDAIGTPTTAEFDTADGTMQLTSNGALYWHKDSGTVAFTDGYHRSALVGSDLVQWVGDQVDAPKPVVQLPSYTVNARVLCIEQAESGGKNVPNAHGSGAVGVMQYMPGTFAAHAAEMGHPDWSPWIPWQAEAVAAYDLAPPRNRRSQWTVAGC